MSDELWSRDALGLADLVRHREVSPVELVGAAIDRIEKLNPRVNAVINETFEKARMAATSPDLPEGPFRGVPFLLKDLGAYSAGDPFHAGMKLLRDIAWTEREDSYLAAKLRRAGFVLLGKTNTPELGLLPTTEPDAYGPTRNPWDPSRSAGGSSGGSAAAVACGMVPAAHASDGGGSIRIPASACGLVGLKATRGRFSMGPMVGEVLGGIAIEGVVSRSVRDTAAIIDAIHGPMPGDPYTAPPPSRPYALEVGADPGQLRVGLLDRIPGGEPGLHPDCVAAVRDTARLLESLGHHVEETYPEALDEAPDVVSHFMALWATRTAGSLDTWSQRTGRPVGPSDVEPLTWALAEAARSLPAPSVVASLGFLHGFTRRLARWWAEGFDLLLSPTLGEPPARLGEFAAKPDDPLWGMKRCRGYVAFTGQFNVSGQPAISLPLHWSAAGLPIGIQLAAAFGREDLLLRIAAQLEQARPWGSRRPQIHASVA